MLTPSETSAGRSDSAAGAASAPTPVTIGRRPGAAPPPNDTAPPTAASPGAAPAADGKAAGVLVDWFGRVHRDLRVSLTDRCQLRCTYCMPEEGLPWAKDVLSPAEVARVVGVAAGLGVTEVRLTGGEPLLRRDLLDIVEA